jgi:hypothetical protein
MLTHVASQGCKNESLQRSNLTLSFLFQAFLSHLLKENIHLLPWLFDESLIYRSHEELLEYAVVAGCLGVKAVSC